MPSCELCGRSMKGHGRNVTIEGAEMLVCLQCAAKFGSQSSGSDRKPSSAPRTQPSWTQPHSDRSPTSSATHRTSPTPKKTSKSPRRSPATLEDMILIEDYAQVIRNARQKARMSQEELAQCVGERISTLQAIESGRIKPTKKTIRGLERELEISLLEAVGPVPIKPSQGVRGSGPTLGDRVVVKRKKSQKSE
ncbi:MAG: multiprotein bridging factor aMBF1 [Candidatus Thorarchaeota archaeon]